MRSFPFESSHVDTPFYFAILPNIMLLLHLFGTEHLQSNSIGTNFDCSFLCCNDRYHGAPTEGSLALSLLASYAIFDHRGICE